MDANPEVTIHQVIEDYSAKYADHIAIRDCDNLISYSYGELNQKANQLAHYLRSFELSPDNFIAIALDRSPELIISILSVLKSGCAYLPLDAEQPEQQLEFILNDSKAAILITQSNLKDKFKGFTGRIIFIDEDKHHYESHPSHNPVSPVQPHHLAYVIYTSGSTGKPKGVLIEHQSVVNYIRWFSLYTVCRAQSRIDFSSSIAFDMAVTTTIAALALGLEIVICQDQMKKDIRQYRQYLHQNEINIIKLTPSYLKVLIQDVKNHLIELPKLSMIILGGEILHTKECQDWLEIYPQHILYNEYGPTETTVAVTEFKITSMNITELNSIAPIGKPGLNTYCLLPDHDIAELHVGGKCLARGYLNQEEMTKQVFIHDDEENKLFKTGDLCHYLEDGNLEYVERIDDQIKIRGFRVEPGETETCLAAHPEIAEIRVVAHHHDSDENQLIAYYIPKDHAATLKHEALREYLQERLAEYKIPSAFVMVPSFPLTPNGKLDKKALPKHTLVESTIAAETSTEEQLLIIWKKLFHQSQLSMDSHFFNLGGHSLTAARLVIEIENTFNKSINIKNIYEAPTIRELATVISHALPTQNKVQASHFVTHLTKDIPLSDFQFLFWISGWFEPKIKKLNIIARRRVSEKLDMKILLLAWQWVLKQHEVLSYQIEKILPLQYLKMDHDFHINETDLSSYSDNEAEKKLNVSMDELLNHDWRRNKPLFVVKAFHLKEMTELQISISHYLFDDASEDILFADLSRAYCYYSQNKHSLPIQEPIQYKNYIMYENAYLNQQIERDIIFWKKYLSQTYLLPIPENEIIHKMNNMPYSSYLNLSNDIIIHLNHLCIAASISITDLLCASVVLSLKKSIEHLKGEMIINIIRSTRNNESHDKMIGCFLRIDAIKVDLDTTLNFIELAKQIQQSRIETEPYQACSGMVKLACLDQKNLIKHLAMNFVGTIYCKLFKKTKLNFTMLQMYARLKSLKNKQQFIVNINLLHHFLQDTNNESLFGKELVKIKLHEYDLSLINNVLDICLFKNMDDSYLVVSGNLKLGFRERLGRNIIQFLAEKTS